MDTTSMIVWVVVAITGLLGLVFAFNKKKTIADKSKWVFATPLLLVGLFLALLQAGVLVDINPALVPLTVGGVVVEEGLPSGPTASVTGCDLSASLTGYISGVDATTGVASGGSHAYSLDGAPFKTVSDTGSFSFSPYQNIKVVYMNASTGDQYFSLVKDYTLPCKTTTLSEKLYKNDTSAIDVDFYNDDGDKMDEGTSYNQSIGASATKYITLKWKGVNGVGYPYGVVAVFDFNKTAFDDWKIVGAEEVATPNTHSVRTTFDTTRAYLIGPQIGLDDIEYKVQIDSSAIEPVDDKPMSNGINVTFYPANYYFDDDVGGIVAGPSPEDEDNAQTFSQSDVINLFVE